MSLIYSRDFLLEVKVLISKLGSASSHAPAAASSVAGASRRSVPVVKREKVSKRATGASPAITTDERAQLAMLQRQFQSRARAVNEEKVKAEVQKVEEAKKRVWAKTTPPPAAAHEGTDESAATPEEEVRPSAPKVEQPTTVTAVHAQALPVVSEAAATGKASVAKKPHVWMPVNEQAHVDLLKLKTDAAQATEEAAAAEAAETGEAAAARAPRTWMPVAAPAVHVDFAEAPMSRRQRQYQRRSRSAGVRGESTRQEQQQSSSSSNVAITELWESVWRLAPFYYPVVFPVAVNEKGEPWDARQLPEYPATHQHQPSRPFTTTTSPPQHSAAPETLDKKHRRKDNNAAKEQREQRCAAIRDSVKQLLDEKIAACAAADDREQAGDQPAAAAAPSQPSGQAAKRKRMSQFDRASVVAEIAEKLGAEVGDVVHVSRSLAAERKQQPRKASVGPQGQSKQLPQAAAAARTTQGNLKPALSDTEARKRIQQRERQLELGKSTIGYLVWKRHCELGLDLPVESVPPPVHQTCSKRGWDGQVRKWRRMLHHYDDLASAVLTQKEIEVFAASKKRRTAAAAPTNEAAAPA